MGTLKQTGGARSMRPDVRHPQVIKKLADAIAGPLSIIFERSWGLGSVPKRPEESKCHSSLQAEGSGELQAVQLHLSPWQSDGVINPRSCFQTHEGKEKDWGSQHGFMKEKSHLSNLIDFYYDVTSLIHEGRALDVVHFDFSEDFQTVSHINLIDKPMKYGLNKWTVRWIEQPDPKGCDQWYEV